MYKKILILNLILLSTAGLCFADCPLDHFLIGCNQDGITGTNDDDKLFVDCTQKYRHSAPDNSGEPTWLYWHYPLYYNIRYDRYQIGEPGFDIISNDPNRQLQRTANVDYRIIIECLSIKPSFMAKNSTLGIEVNEPGDWINHSALSDPHLHLEYRAPSPSGAVDMQWITYIIYDEFDGYEPSEPFSIVFVQDPPAGDLAIDGSVNINDLSEFCFYWLKDNGSRENDYYERADVDKDGKVDFKDFCLFAANWLTQ
jgi:hypothetical protein